MPYKAYVQKQQSTIHVKEASNYAQEMKFLIFYIFHAQEKQAQCAITRFMT